MTNNSYDELCKQINNEFKKKSNPSRDNLVNLSKKFNVDISVIRECTGLKDVYDFQIDKD